MNPRDDERRKELALSDAGAWLYKSAQADPENYWVLTSGKFSEIKRILAESILARAEQADAPRTAEWIPVTERMPPHDKPVRFFNGMQGDAVCRNSKWFLLYGAEEMLELPNVTHWMPMPNIPSAAAHRPAPTPEQFKNSCNRHSDCAAATEQFKAANGGRSPGVNFHCHDEECEDCFGC